jgi:alkaline phosphatase D
VMMAPFDPLVGPETEAYMDGWAGYPASRERVLAEIAERAPNRTIVLSGDIHSNWVNELHAGFDRPGRPVVGAEFVGTSISSGGDGEDQWRTVPGAMGENPHLKWHTARRGYVVCDVNEREWRADYREVPYVTRPGAPVTTASSWRVAHGRPGIVRA